MVVAVFQCLTSIYILLEQNVSHIYIYNCNKYKPPSYVAHTDCMSILLLLSQGNFTSV